MAAYECKQWDKAMKKCALDLAGRYDGDPIALALDAMELPAAKQCQALDFMEEARPQIRAAFSPIWKYCFAQWIVYDAGCEAIEKNTPLEDALATPDILSDATALAALIDSGGFSKGAKMSEKWTWKMLEVPPKPGAGDNTEQSPVVQAAKEDRAEGVAAFSAGQYPKAFFYFSNGIRVLARLPEPLTSSQSKIACDLYKNLSAAALKLNMYRVALNTANAALSINGDDQKAWFRKACALEKLEIEAEAVEAYAIAGFGDPAVPQQKALAETAFGEDKYEPNMQDKVEELVFIEVGIDSISAVDMIEILQEQVDNEAKIPLTLTYDCFTVGEAVTYLKDSGASMSRGDLVKLFWTAMGNVLGQDPLKVPAMHAKQIQDEKALGIVLGLTEAFEKPEWAAKAKSIAERAGYDFRTFLLGLRRRALDVQHPTLEARGFQGNYEGLRSLQCAMVSSAKKSQQVQDLLPGFKQALYGGPKVMKKLLQD
mmetsp:Transcript_138096/g.240175  ORF Transcript_138096/g.240175 Transcript_138096/m.240175 type:complete len:484 (+) Transcript_138096:74-1525(+)